MATGLLTTPEGPLPLSHLGGQAPAIELVIECDEEGAAVRTADDTDGAGVRGTAEPAVLLGYGPVTSQVARQIASCAVSGARPLVRLIHRMDADTAQRLADRWRPERPYKPSAALARHIRTRNSRCV